MNMQNIGKTQAMILSIPASGAVIVVPVYMDELLMRRMIAEVRGKKIAKACKIVVVATMRDTEALRGSERPIRVDHSWYAHPAIERGVPAMLDAFIMRAKRYEPRKKTS